MSQISDDTFDRVTLLRWAEQNRLDAERMRRESVRLAALADDAERRAALCERDAAEVQA